MSLLAALLAAVEASAPAAWLRGSFIGYPLVNALHVAAVGSVLAAVVMMDLHVLGVVRRAEPAAAIRLLRPLAMVAVAVAVVSGLLLVSVRPFDYAANPAFRIKLVLLAAALANAAVFLARGRDGGPIARLLAGVSLLLWPAVLVAGRFIGFV